MRFARRARTAAAGNAQPCFASEMPGARGASFDCRPRSGAPETSSTAQARTAAPLARKNQRWRGRVKSRSSYEAHGRARCYGFASDGHRCCRLIEGDDNVQISWRTPPKRGPPQGPIIQRPHGLLRQTTGLWSGEALPGVACRGAQDERRRGGEKSRRCHAGDRDPREGDV